MTDSVHPAISFDAALHVGQIVEARFTNSNRALRFRARILKLNERTARVEALEHGVNGWNEGHVFVIQRFSSKLWSANNGLYPPATPRPYGDAAREMGRTEGMTYLDKDNL